jgi:cell division protease FtsH
MVTDQLIQGRFKEPRKDGKTQFKTVRMDSELVHELKASGSKFTQVIENTIFKDLLSWILPALIFVGVWFYLGRKLAEKSGMGGGGLMSVGKSRAKIYVESNIKVTFSDVAGVDEAKEELQEVVEFLKKPKEYGRLGARMPKGILLVGPPGTGKTLLAKAVAGEAGVTFFSISGSEFVEMFVGVGAARVRDLFEQARKKSPCIVFIDELDSLGKARSGTIVSGGHDEKEQTLNQLLAELDGFDPTSGVVLLAATNRPEILDPALLRAGRFDRQILVDKPDRVGREAILQVHIKKVKIDPTINISQIAELTPGFTGADLANLVNEAALAATRRKSEMIQIQDFNTAIERIVAGLEKRNRLLNPKERKVVAYHEMGHALVAMSIPGSDKVHKISIIPRGIGSLGYTIQRPTEDRFLMTEQELLNKMAVLFGGRVAEEIIFNEISTGASDDLSRITSIAEALVLKYGMNSDLGPIVFDRREAGFLRTPEWMAPDRPLSESTLQKIDQAIASTIDKARKRAREILTERRELLNRGAEMLLEKETLTEAELMELLRS